MGKRINVADLPVFDASMFLKTKEGIVAYLTDILEARDAGLLAAALGDVARALGLTEIANKAGISREALCEAMRAENAPRFETISRVLAAFGVRLVATPIETTSADDARPARKNKAKPSQSSTVIDHT
jgi:probable addiction module antidote protein